MSVYNLTVEAIILLVSKGFLTIWEILVKFQIKFLIFSKLEKEASLMKTKYYKVFIAK
jgi:hypothetical protein